MDPRWIEDVLSGRRRDTPAAALRAGLSLVSPLYRSAIAARNLAFDRGWKSVQPVGAPVLSIGNITTGGTGKTPFVAWLVEWLRNHGRRPAIISRGYRSLDGAENDEKRLLDALCPGVPHVQNPDRAAGARQTIAESQCDVIVLDDGFQHRRLARDLDIVLIDALNPWGYGHLLPRGLLREPPASLRRAGVVCLTRVDLCAGARREALLEQVRRLTDAVIAETSFIPTGLVTTSGETTPLGSLHGRNVGACCGVGHPTGFFRTLERLTGPLDPSRRRTYPDHHHYSPADLSDLAKWTEAQQLDLLVVTRKDLVKIPATALGRAALVALEIGVRWESGRAEVEQRLSLALGAVP